MKKNRVKLTFKVVLALLLIIGIKILLTIHFFKFLTAWPYFSVKEVICSELLKGRFDYLKGQSIFAVNLAQEASEAGVSCPDCLKVRIVRILPDRIFVEFVKRKPVALVRLYRYFAVDRYGFFFNLASDMADTGLPVITGLEAKLSRVSAGMKPELRELHIALDIIREINKLRFFNDYRIQRVNVANADDITVFIPLAQPAGINISTSTKQKILEVRISQGNIVEKVAVMSGLMNQERNNLANIKYIDLRFKEPVIKFKDVK